MTWSEFTQNDAFRNASPEGRAAAKQKFFERVMVPEMRNKGMSDERITPFYQRFMETPDDTGEGLIRSALGSAARGFFDPLAAAPEVAGAYLGIEGLEEFGSDVRGAIEGAFPVNPAEQGLVTDVAGVVGQVGQIVATGGGGSFVGGKLIGKGATELAKKQAEKFGARAAVQTAMGSSAVAGGLERAEQLGLEGGDRLLRGAIAGGTELLAERLGGFATELGPVNKFIGQSAEEAWFKPIIRGVGTEALEEGGAEAAGQATDIAMAPEAAPGMDLKNIGYAMLLGGVGGAAFGGIEAAITPRTKKAFDGTTDFIPSSGPPPGMTVEEAEDQDLLKYGNAGEIIGYVLPVSDETVEGDLPLTVDTNVEPLVENVAATPEANATASALRRIATEGAGAPAATQEIPDEIVTDETTALRDAGLRMLTGQPAPVTAKAEETVDTIADEWLASQPKGMQEVIESNVQRLIQSGLNRLGGFVGKDGELDTGRIEAYRKELRKLGFDLDIDNPIGDMALWKKTGVKNFPVIPLQQAQPAPVPAQAETVTPAPVAEEIITEQEDEQIPQETLQQEQSRGQELQEPRELPILPAEPTAQAPEAAVGAEAAELEQQKATLPVDGEGAMLQGGDVRQEETQEQPDRLMDVPSTMQYIYQQNLSKTDTEKVKKLLEKNEKEARKQGRIQGARSFYESDVNTAIEEVMASKQDSAEFRKKLETAKRNKDFSPELSSLLDSLEVEEASLRGIQSEKGMFGVQWAERNVRTRETNKKKEIRALKERIVAISPSEIALKAKKPSQQVSATADVPTASLPAGQLTSGDVGVAAAQSLQPPPLSEGPYKQRNEEIRANTIARGFIWDGENWIHPEYPGATIYSSDVPQPTAARVREELAKIRGDERMGVSGAERVESRTADIPDEAREDSVTPPWFTVGRFVEWKEGVPTYTNGKITGSRQIRRNGKILSIEDGVAEIRRTDGGFSKKLASEVSDQPNHTANKPIPDATPPPQAQPPAATTATQEAESKAAALATEPATEATAKKSRKPKATAKSPVEQLREQGLVGFPLPAEQGGGWVGIKDWRSSFPLIDDLWNRVDLLRAVANNRGVKASSQDLEDALALAQTLLGQDAPDLPSLGWDISMNPAATASTKEAALAFREAAEERLMGEPATEESTAAEPAEAVVELTELPSYFQRNPQQKKLWDVDESYAEPARISQSVGDKIGPRGTAFTVEQLMYQIAVLREFVSNMNGRLLRGGDKGASTKELAEKWTTLRGFEALAAEYAAENPQEWQSYRNRQNELLGLEAGADVIVPYASPDTAPLGNIGKLDKKFSKNWRVIYPNGETALFHPTALRAVSSTDETVDTDVIEEVTPLTQAQAAIVDKLPELEARDAQRRGLGFDYPRARIGRLPGDQNAYISRPDQKNVGVLSPDGSIKMLSPEESVSIQGEINAFEKRQAAQIDKRMATLREEAKKQSESKLYQLTPSDPVVRRLDGKWINNNTGKPLSRSKNDQRLLSQLENNPNIESYQVVAQSTDGGVSFIPVSRAAQPAAGETGDAGVAISPTGEIVQPSETPSALSKLQSYISTLSPKDQQLWTPERLAAAESYYVTGNESALEPLTATQRKVVKREGASESDAAAYEAEQKRQFALRNPPAATDSQFLEDYNAYVNSLSDETLQKERESREEAPGVGDVRYSKQLGLLDKKHAELEKRAKAGDKAAVAEAERMVAEAAREAGGIEVFHSGNIEGNVIDVNKRVRGAVSERREGTFYGSTSENVARSYPGKLNKMFFFLSNPFKISTPKNRPASWAGKTAVRTRAGIVERKSSLSIGEAVDRAKNNGYDGVVYGNIVDTGSMWGYTGSPIGDTVVAFDPNQIKSADPFTYDDAGKLIPLSERFQPDSPDIRYKKILRSADGNIRRTGVKSTPARAARNSYIGVIPGVENTWLGTVEEFDAEFPDGYPFDSKTTTPPADTEALVAEDGRAFIFIDRVQVLDGDAERAEQHGTSPGVEAIKRLLRHESFVHRGFMSLPGPLKARFADFVASGIIPEAELDHLVNNGYPQYAGWRDIKSTEMLAAEEWLAQRVERMGRIPQSGPIASIMDWLRDVWRWLTGGETTDLDKLRNTMRAMHKALGALDPKQRIVMELPDMDVLRRSVAQTQQDQEYLNAVAAGDMETAQRMVDDAARAAGYIVGPVWRADTEVINVYDNTKLTDSTGFFFFPEKSDAVEWGESLVWRGRTKSPTLLKAYLKLQNPREGARIEGFSRQEAKAEMLRQGFDGAIHLGGREILVFDPSQIKSADPVTYDSNGAPIPPSQRFQSTSSDIRYSKVQRPVIGAQVDALSFPGVGTASQDNPMAFEREYGYLPAKYYKMAEKGEVANALQGYAKEAVAPYATSKETLLELIEILRDDRKILDTFGIGATTGQAGLGYIYAEGALQAEKMGDRVLTEAFAFGRKAVGTSKGQGLVGEKFLVNDQRYQTLFAIGSVDSTRRNEQQAVVNAKVGKPTAAKVGAEFEGATETARDTVADAIPSELQISEKVLELGAAVQGNPTLTERVKKLISNVIDRGRKIRALQKLKSQTRASIIPDGGDFENMSEAELEAEIARLTKEIEADMDFIEKEVAKDAGKEKTPSDSAQRIIKRIITKAKRKERKEGTPDPVEELYKADLKSPMNEADFIKKAVDLGVEENVALELKNAIDLQLTAKALQDALSTIGGDVERNIKKANEEANKFQKQADAIIEKVVNRMADPPLVKEKKAKAVDPLQKAYRDQLKKPVSREEFIENLEKINVFDQTASLLFDAAEMERTSREAIAAARKQPPIPVETAKAIINRVQKQAAGETTRAKPKLDRVRLLYKAHLRERMAETDFMDEAKAAGLTQQVAQELYDAAELEIAAILLSKEVRGKSENYDKLTRERLKHLDVDSSALVEYINRLRREGKLGPVNWRDIMQLPPTRQQVIKGTLLELVKQNPQLQNLSAEEQQTLADALEKVWERERERQFKLQVKRLEMPGAKQEDQEKVVSATPRIIKLINQGMLAEDAFYKAVGEQFGIKEMSDADRKRIIELSEIIQDNAIPEADKAKEVRELVTLLQKYHKLTTAEILSNVWVAHVLSGVRTQFDMAMGFQNGFLNTVKKAGLVIYKNPNAKGAKTAAKGIQQFFVGLVDGMAEAARYIRTEEPGLVRSDIEFINSYFEGGLKKGGLSTARKLRESDNKFLSALGSWLAILERVNTGWDVINYRATYQGTLAMAQALNPKIYKEALMPTTADFKAMEERAKTMLGADATRAQIKSRAFQYIEDGVHLLGKNLDESFMQEWKQMAAEFNYDAKEAAMMVDPTGIGGLFYRGIMGITEKAETAAKARADKAKEELLDPTLGRDQRFIRQVFPPLMYLLASQARNILGVRFIRFTGNKINELISYIPIAGMARIYLEEGMTRNNELTIKAMSVQMNQLIATAIMIPALIKAMYDLEDDDEERGYIIQGPWDNLTPERKSQLMADGFKPNTIAFYNKKTGRWTSWNYINWPSAGWFATAGSVSDYRRYTPEKWDEKTAAAKFMSGIYAGGSSFLDISSISQMTELFGRSTYSTDPATKGLEKVTKLATGYAGGFVPRIAKDVDLWFDKTVYKPEDTWGHIAKEMPFYRRNTGAPLRDIFYEPVQVSRTPWSRALQVSPDDPAYKALGRLNSRGIWLTPANPENRKVKRGGKLRDMTDEEANAYMAEVGKRYKEFVMKQGDRLLEMDVDRADELVSKYTARIREIAFKKAIASSAKTATR